MGRYYRLAKPGIIYGNLITTSAGFFLASHALRGSVDYGLWLWTLLGISLVMACGCVLNNYIDRGIDARMSRTKDRELVTGAVSVRNALIYAAILGVAGFAVLAWWTNLLTVMIAAGGVFFYIVLYSLWKRRSMYGAHIGSI